MLHNTQFLLQHTPKAFYVNPQLVLELSYFEHVSHGKHIYTFVILNSISDPVSLSQVMMTFILNFILKDPSVGNNNFGGGNITFVTGDQNFSKPKFSSIRQC